MSTPTTVKHWPRFAFGPKGNRAKFQSAGDVPHGWKLEVPIPGTEEPPKRGPGRPPKVVTDDE